jgi:hypothetical protein
LTNRQRRAAIGSDAVCIRAEAVSGADGCLYIGAALPESVVLSHKEKFMRKFGTSCAAVAVLGVAMVAFSRSGNVTAANADDKEKAKYTIGEVMQQAHKSGLWKKVAAGNADKADREKLAELYKALAQGKPPKGELDEWKKTTEVMQKIAEDAIKDPEAGKKLKVNCGQCHGKFKQ